MKYSPQIGDKIEVTQPHLKWDLCIYQVTKTSIEGDSRGQTELSTLETHEKGVQTNRYELSENTIVVDSKWFDELLTKRNIRKLDDLK